MTRSLPQELAKKVWLGSADTRVWVVQAADAEQPADGAGKCAKLGMLQDGSLAGVPGAGCRMKARRTQVC